MLHKSETDAVTTSGKQRRQVGTPEKNLPPKSKAKLSSLGKEKLFNKRTSFFWRKAATDAFFITTKSQTVCVDNFVKERRFRKPIISLGTFYNWSVKVLSVFPVWNPIEKFPSLASPFVRRQPSENSRNFAKKKSNLWSVVCLTLATFLGKLLRRKKKIFVCGCE